MNKVPVTTKKKRVCIGLTKRSWNRFEAEHGLNDHTLNSSVATLQNHYGIPIERKREVVPGYQGAPTSCCRYWIAKENIEHVLKIIQDWK